MAIVIHPPNQLPQSIMSKYQDIWSEIFPKIQRVFSEETCSMTKTEYFNYYTMIYNLCAVGDDEIDRKKLFIYNKVKDFLREKNEIIFEDGNKVESEESILIYFGKKWENYRFKSKVLDNLFSALTKFPHEDMVKIQKLSKILWCENIKMELGKRAINAIFSLLKKDREGNQIDGSLIRHVIDCYADLKDINSETKKIFEEQIKKPIIQETFEYYSKESYKLLERLSFSEYVLKCLEIFEQEEKRVNEYLHNTFWTEMHSHLVRSLVTCHSEKFEHGMVKMLENYQIDDARNTHRLVMKNEALNNKLADEFYVLVKRHGEDSIKGHVESKPNPLDDFKCYTKAILEPYKRDKHLLENGLENDVKFREAFDKGCGSYINYNELIKKAGSSKKGAFLLAKKSDYILNKSSKDIHDLEESVQDVITIFTYINDKDVFKLFYFKMMGVRELNDNSVGQDAENLFLQKLKETCGFDYVNKLQRFHNDIKLSQELNENYARIFETIRHPVQFYVQVISASSAPFSTKSRSFLLPKELEYHVSSFQDFYHGKHQGRKLTWNYVLSKGELVSNCFQKRFNFTVSTFQISILLQFNEALEHTVEDLIKAVGFEKELFLQILQILLKSQLLLCKNDSNQSITDYKFIQPHMKISLNTNYNNKKTRINLNAPIKSEDKKDEDDTYKQLEMQRDFIVQAAIVRVMKSRKTIVHNDLILEVLQQIRPNFSVQTQHIKKNIEELIHKDYMKRSDGNRDTYEYVA